MKKASIALALAAMMSATPAAYSCGYKGCSDTLTSTNIMQTLFAKISGICNEMVLRKR